MQGPFVKEGLTIFTVLGRIDGHWWAIGQACTGVEASAMQLAKANVRYFTEQYGNEVEALAVHEARLGPGIDWGMPMAYPPGYEPDGLVKEL